MEAKMDAYKLVYMKVEMQYLLAFPMQIAEQVRQGVEETDSFKQECADMNKKVETVLQLLRQAARVYSSSSTTTTTKLQQSSPRGGLQLYERPIRRIMLQVTKALYRALVLVRKCKKIGILRMVISSITNTTADFRKANLFLGSSIADITWLLSISAYGEDRPEVSGLPPIASADPVLGTVWEQVSIVQFGTPDKKAEAADYLGTCAEGNQRYVKIIVREEGVPPLLRLLKEGTLSGQEAAARAIGQLARDPGRIKSMVKDGAPAAFVHVLRNHTTSMKVQIEVARVISLFASQDEEVQNELALLGAIRLLVALLAHDLIDDTALKVTNNKSPSFHSIVQSLGEQKVQADGACDSGQASTQDLTGQTGNHFDTDLEPAPVGLEPGSVVTHGRRSTTYCQSTRQTSALHQGNQNPQDKLEDPEIMLKAEAAHALWKLAANNVNNSTLITDTCALLCFSKLIETGHRTVKYNSIMAIMEITAAAEKDSKLRMTAFRANSAAVKAVVECLLRVLEAEADKPNLQAPCAKALGSLAHIFPARARAQITALTRALGSENSKVAGECAIALSKFANKENYLHLQHSETILEQGATDHLVQLVSFGDEGDANGKIHALQLLCFLSLHAATSDDALAATLPALLTVSLSRSPLLAKHENIRPLLMTAIILKLKALLIGGSHENEEVMVSSEEQVEADDSEEEVEADDSEEEVEADDSEEEVEADDSEEEVEADDSKGRSSRLMTVKANDSEEEVEADDSEDYNLTDSTEQEGPRSPFHSQVGRSSIPALNMDASCSQVPQNVHRKFHELGQLETAKNKERKHDNQFTELKSSSGSFKEPNLTKVDGPSTYLELGTKSLKNVENTISIQSSNSVLINQLQCQYLFDKLRESLNEAKACIDCLSPQDIPRSCCVLESLAQTWKEGEILVGDCCDAQWIRAAMILANAKEHFTSLIFKLRLYMQLFQSIFKEGATKEFLIKLQDRKWSDDVKDEEFRSIDVEAFKDQQWLLSKLIEVGSIDSENLIKRLNHPGKIDAWKVAHKSIQRAPNGQIGKGGSAIVHKVVWLGKHFAEKCFFGPENKHFQEEASLLAGLSHPNILPLFCFVTRAHSCSLVTELMDGDLHELMCKRLENDEIQGVPFKLLEAIDIMLQVAEGMHYLHQKKVVHRDLKSMNILVNCDGHDGHVYAKVADFGLSKTKESSCTYSKLTMDQGTTRWMAPELFGDFDQSVPTQVCQETQHPSLSNEQISKKYPFKVDIYSFGMVCYEILTGNIPFHNHTSMTKLRKEIKDGLRPNLPEQCPQQLSKLLQECYHSDPATRPSFFEICVKLRHIMCSLMIGCTL